MSTPSKLSEEELDSYFAEINDTIQQLVGGRAPGTACAECGVKGGHTQECQFQQIRSHVEWQAASLATKDAELEQQAARIKTLEAALEPFAEALFSRGYEWGLTKPEKQLVVWTVNYGDFRRAAAALKGEG